MATDQSQETQAPAKLPLGERLVAQLGKELEELGAKLESYEHQPGTTHANAFFTDAQEAIAEVGKAVSAAREKLDSLRSKLGA